MSEEQVTSQLSKLSPVELGQLRDSMQLEEWDAVIRSLGAAMTKLRIIELGRLLEEGLSEVERFVYVGKDHWSDEEPKSIRRLIAELRELADGLR